MPATAPTKGPARRRGFWLLVRVLVLLLLWLGLNGTDGRSWLVGLPVVALAVYLATRLAPTESWRVSLTGAVRFALFFAVESLRGGVDVARRALGPAVVLAPGLIQYRTRLPSGAPRWLFCNSISLLPGTAVVGIEGADLCIHALDRSAAAETELQRLEARVGALFALELGPGEAPGP
jgi:multicomponent Na+:H+ antiporter subunit E